MPKTLFSYNFFFFKTLNLPSNMSTSTLLLLDVKKKKEKGENAHNLVHAIQTLFYIIH